MGAVQNKNFSGCPQKEGNEEPAADTEHREDLELQLKSPKGAIAMAIPAQHSN